MMRTIFRIMTVCFVILAAVPALAQKPGKIVLGTEITPKDTTKVKRFTNRLIAPKGEWQVGLSAIYADFNSANSDYMLVLQGLGAKASLLRVAPEIAYTFCDNHSVGLKFNYTRAGGMLDEATADLLGNLSLSVGDIQAMSSSIGGSLFQRTYVGIDKHGRFGIFWDYILGYTRSNTVFGSGAEDDTYSVKDKFFAAFAPGVVYFPMNNVSLQANISIADVSYSCTTAYQDAEAVGRHTGWRAQAGLNLLNLSFGLTIHL